MEPLTAVRAALRTCDFYSPRSKGTVAEWVHPKMLAHFGLDAEWARGKPNIRAGCCAFDPAFEEARALARRWREWAPIKECIAPEGSSRSNHRQDQALLTVLAYLAGLAEYCDQPPLGFMTHQDIDGWRMNAIMVRLKRFLFPRGAPPALRRLRDRPYSGSR